MASSTTRWASPAKETEVSRSISTRLEQTLPAESDVGEPRFPVDVYGEHHVRPRQRSRSGPHAGFHRDHRESDLAEDCEKHRVLLEAIPAPLLDDQLVVKPVGVERNATAEQDVEILEGDRGDVRFVQASQRFQVRAARRRQPEALQVGEQAP